MLYMEGSYILRTLGSWVSPSGRDQWLNFNRRVAYWSGDARGNRSACVWLPGSMFPQRKPCQVFLVSCTGIYL